MNGEVVRVTTYVLLVDYRLNRRGLKGDSRLRAGPEDPSVRVLRVLGGPKGPSGFLGSSRHKGLYK